MTLDEFIEQELNKPPRNKEYSPDGDSSRAVVTRMRKNGLLCALKWELLKMPSAIKSFLVDEFDGWNTPIIWFVTVAVMPITIPIAPFLSCYMRYNRALEDYRAEWRVKENLKSTQK